MCIMKRKATTMSLSFNFATVDTVDNIPSFRGEYHGSVTLSWLCNFIDVASWTKLKMMLKWSIASYPFTGLFHTYVATRPGVYQLDITNKHIGTEMSNYNYMLVRRCNVVNNTSVK